MPKPAKDAEMEKIMRSMEVIIFYNPEVIRIVSPFLLYSDFMLVMFSTGYAGSTQHEDVLKGRIDEHEKLR